MTSYPDRKYWGKTLADRHGVWCAWCLKYICPKHFHNHHMVSRSYINQYFGPRFPKGWKIPCHDRCHLPTLQRFSAGIESNLLTLQLGPNNSQKLDIVSSKFHQAGLYWPSIFLKEHLRQKLLQHGVSLDSDDNWSRIGDILNSAAGARMAERLPGILIQNSRRPKKVGLLLNLANFHSNYGHLPTAEKWLKAAEEAITSLPRQHRDTLRESEARRIAQVRRYKPAGYEAIQLSKSSFYSINTSYILTAWIELSEGKYDRARDLFEKVLRADGILTWLYKAESWFGLAVTRIEQRDNLKEAFKLLICAQYVYVLLGIQGTPHPEVLTANSSHPADLMPGDIIVNHPRLKLFDSKQCLGMRREVICGENLFWKLNNLLSGHTLV